MKKRTLTILIAVVLVVACAVGGTLAWLTATSGPVTNTFTAGDVSIQLAETKTDFKMVPGYVIEKDPKITVNAKSEKCYLFVKVDKTGVTYTVNGSTVTKSFDDYISYDMADGWLQLKDASNNNIDGVYYREVETSTKPQEFDVIGYRAAGSSTFTDNEVLVKNDVTKEMLNGLSEDNYPTLTFTAYAVQYMKNNTESFTAAEAWDEVKPTP